MRYLLLALLLASCATPEERAERDIAAHAPYCDKMGYQRDTDAWRSCIQQAAADRRASVRAAQQRSQETQRSMREAFEKSR